MRFIQVVALILTSVAGTVFAQHEYTAAEADIGRQQYTNNCTRCHGPEGDAVTGVDLGRGRFRLATSDGDLIRIMKTGISGTGMPPNNLTDAQAQTIVAYLRSMAASAASATVPPGDASRGKTIFEGKGECSSCHRVGANGSRVGPDLTEIGGLRRAVELQRSIMDPSAEVLPSNRFVRVTTRNGVTITGRLLNQDSFTVQLLDSKEQLSSFSRSDLREYTFLKDSPMPSYRDKLTSQEAADLVRYLASLKAQVNP